jgi:hypothetical protein
VKRTNAPDDNAQDLMPIGVTRHPIEVEEGVQMYLQAGWTTNAMVGSRQLVTTSQVQESWPPEPVVHKPRRRRRPMGTMAEKLVLMLCTALPM